MAIYLLSLKAPVEESKRCERIQIRGPWIFETRIHSELSRGDTYIFELGCRGKKTSSVNFHFAVLLAETEFNGEEVASGQFVDL